MQHDDMGTGVSTALERYRLIDVALLADFLASHLVCEKRHGRISLTDESASRKNQPHGGCRPAQGASNEARHQMPKVLPPRVYLYSRI
jgi:hypothetical protein